MATSVSRVCFINRASTSKVDFPWQIKETPGQNLIGKLFDHQILMILNIMPSVDPLGHPISFYARLIERIHYRTFYPDMRRTHS